ncbi:MAG: class I SAM-dependent methyltransferase, partial [Rhodospirillales bacterium]
AGRVRRVNDFVEAWQGEQASERAALDVGAGLGVFLAGFQQECRSSGGWQAVALEPDPLAAQHLRSIGSFAVVSDVFPCSLPHPAYHLVTLNKVLEHVPDPLQLIEQLSKVMHPEWGVIHIEVPDKLTIGRRPPNDNILGALHCHLYDPRSLVSLIERAGLSPLAVERVLEPSGKITVFAFAALPSSIDNHVGSAAPTSGI